MTTETLTLTDFLLARVAEDEYEANVCLDQYARGDGGSTPRWRRQLAECKAKRAIVEDEVSHWTNSARADSHILRALAAIYADHEDYRAEWVL